jgi:nicotinamidase/pyrazinamidase
LVLEIGRKKTALLIVDVQNDFCPGGQLPVLNGNHIVPVINRVTGRFGIVVATQDWHPQAHVSFASNHPGKKPFERVHIGGIEQILWPDHCVQGTEGAAFHPELNLNGINLILRKGIRSNLDSYSGFFENDRKTPTGLSYYLGGLGIKELYVCGLAFDVCVFHTALDSVRLRFNTFLIEDASRGVDVPSGNITRTREEMKRAGVRFVLSNELAFST